MCLQPVLLHKLDNAIKGGLLASEVAMEPSILKGIIQNCTAEL
jgi:hypothetical protein